ncbi:MAG: cyclic pyranopterin monophosphate synthase MoaC [Verrucomicrobiota bacterium]|nr:cyclic pyranopterin monophosphate synthase MoaC [Verrucomicrobiales bacterium]MEC9042288.1 cyclic pyranopterin monophosphate synthase MoaC [Verrucomicrobiota bacterium]MEC9112332.1 cyclic pyranopterin monophosphate synthase MoaC [Verrucomicrobiota bacterium]MED5259747.1 cyclic pyranopterin monophosphate synthase MoaC [Verrucomicrobiota bacterium]MED5458064.1 cyclic pyranopterin monophosphate synthase MoaC [Verrucomicrobiota bacterium]
MSELTHINDDGEASMVDVGDKDIISRVAIASGFIRLKGSTLDLIYGQKIKKGDVLTVAKIAGISAAKKTAEMIPLCHQIPISHVSVDFTREEDGIKIEAKVKTHAKTGVEMEALSAVSNTALTLYDMCKAVDKEMQIERIRLDNKEKGES